jgi:hypothetical protein
MRIQVLCAIALIPAGLWAGSIGLPGNDTLFTFGSNQFGVTDCGSPCSIDGSTSPLPLDPDYMVTWTFQFSNPISYSTGLGGQSGNFVLGTLSTPASFTLWDNDGASIVGNVMAPPAPTWTSSVGDGTVLRFAIDISSSTVPGGDPLGTLLDNSLGAIPQTGNLLAVQLDITCTNDSDFVQCMGQTDPQGSVTAGVLTNAITSAPEPGAMALLAGGIAAMLVRRLLTSHSYSK